jgi:hypothetical protein
MPALVHRRLRAPTADGAALFEPPLAATLALLSANRAAGEAFDRLGWFSSGFRNAARESLVRLSLDPVGPPPSTSGPYILTGHQPELYHPGVWLKNFAASEIASAAGGRAMNLVVDNDLCRSAGIRVPVGMAGSAGVQAVAFDDAAEPVPWECRSLMNEQTFASFAARVQEALVPLQTGPEGSGRLILDSLWPQAVAAARWRAYPPLELHEEDAAGQANLCACLTSARASLERQIGLSKEDCFLSAVASDACFMEFAAAILGRHRQFHEVHNRALQEYRHVNHIRSHTHPVPELAREGDWYEVPLWLWTADDPHRRRVFVRERGNSWEVTDRGEITIRARANDAPQMSRLSAFLAGRGVRLRPRALITTMYARLVLSDLFIHGIGGAKYDELTDVIIRRFFGFEPPGYLTATATFRLPIDRPQVTANHLRASAGRLRDLRYRPESFLGDELTKSNADVHQKLAALAADKRDYLAGHDLRRCPPEVFDRLDHLNGAMHDLLRPVEQELRARQAALREQLKQSQLLGSREFSFVLFPADELPRRLRELCRLPA